MKVNFYTHSPAFSGIKNVMSLNYNEPEGKFMMLACQLDNVGSGDLVELNKYNEMTGNLGTTKHRDCLLLTLSKMPLYDTILMANSNNIIDGASLLEIDKLAKGDAMLSNIIKSNLKIYTLLAKITKEIANSNSFRYDGLGQVAEHSLEVLTKLTKDAKSATQVINEVLTTKSIPQPIAMQFNRILDKHMRIFFNI